MDIVDRLKMNPSPYVCIRREAAQEIEALRKKLAEDCTGCAMAPTEDEPTYDEECMGCRRFYGDLFTTEKDTEE